MRGKDALDVINSLDLQIWILIFKFVVAVFLVLAIKEAANRILAWISIRASSGYGTNTQVQYNSRRYFIDSITFSHVILVNGDTRVLIPLKTFLCMPKEIVRTCNEQDGGGICQRKKSIHESKK